MFTFIVVFFPPTENMSKTIRTLTKTLRFEDNIINTFHVDAAEGEKKTKTAALS